MATQLTDTGKKIIGGLFIIAFIVVVILAIVLADSPFFVGIYAGVSTLWYLITSKPLLTENGLTWITNPGFKIGFIMGAAIAYSILIWFIKKLIKGIFF